MKKTLLSISIALLSLATLAQSEPTWIRQAAISPDAKTIVFGYKGDLYTVPTSGGEAKILTSNPAYEGRPIWSPDGRQIAFRSNREGSFDVYVIDAQGGQPRRVTTHSKNETPIAFIDNSTLLFSASIVQDAADAGFPAFSQVWKVSIDGSSRPELYSSLPMEDISINGSKILYHDIKGYEDQWRKHHRSSITRDIWLKDGQTYTKLTSFRGEDRTPIWTADGKGFYFTSEQDGTINIYRRSLTDTTAHQITTHAKHPVRYLSAAQDGTLCYSWDGDLYTVREGSAPQKVAINVVRDRTLNEIERQTLSSGATDFAVSPSGKEVAFIVRGDVFVTSVEFPTTRRITNTAVQERDLDFSPDGRTLIYSSERDGIWNIYQTKIEKPSEKLFTYATTITETPVTESKVASFQGKFSPDGKKIAYYEDRTTLRMLDLDTKKTTTILDGKYNYSYQDGDMNFEWSPDSKFILAKFFDRGGWQQVDVGLINVATAELTNLTQSGYNDNGARWALDGRALIWTSDREGMRSHGSWGATGDIYIMFLEQEAYDKFRMTKEELSLIEPSKDTTKRPVVMELENRKHRIMRLTVNSSNLVDGILSPDGSKLYYLTSFEGQPDLWERDFRENSTKLLIKGVGYGSLRTDKDGKNIFAITSSGLKKIDTKESKITPISFKAELELKPDAERRYIFEHAWQQVADKFYVKDIHNVDWKGYRDAYARFLPYIDNNFDFTEMLGEMLGELNGSHTGARYQFPTTAPQVAVLGLYYDPKFEGDGLKISEVLKGNTMIKAGSRLTPGAVIQKIDGQAIVAGEDYFPLLAGKAGRQTELTIYDPATKQTYLELVKPLSDGAQNELIYRRWVEGRRKLVEKLSDGKIGYIHIRGMNSQSFREVYSELLGRYRSADAVVIDTRNNGGGWLHDDLTTLLSGKEYQRFEPRGQYIGSDPFNKWLRPSIVVQGEGNYSNAHGFPWVYKELGIGKLVGAPVPGTMTAVWWENQVDPSIIFGIPQVAVKDLRGNYLENQELFPDIEVYNTPQAQLSGRDLQIEAAVAELLKK